MNEAELEDKLQDLITAAVDSGLVLGQVISTFETVLMCLREEAEDANH